MRSVEAMLYKLTALTVSSLLLAACGGQPSGSAAPAAPAAAPAAALPRSAAPADAKVYIISPANGATVASPFKVEFGLSGMGVAPAGVQFENTGHHHLLVDVDLPEDMSVPLANDATHLHFGKGQTETTVTLPPGTHTLQLVLGDSLHIPFDPPVISDKITVTVAP
ncbi:MAG: DUF4399 domain-containing protein [Nevskiaceae bacterium]|jgi:hypothetical protein|nr:DUF4399 domain-containing protein [Nevskiaceae bacterium]